MSDSVIDYFVRRYSLVLNNDQDTQEIVNGAVHAVVADSGFTLTEYTDAWNMVERYSLLSSLVQQIGEAVLNLIEEWVIEPFSGDDSILAMLIKEVFYTSGGDLAFAMGKHYLPEPQDVTEILSDDEDF